MAALWQVVSDQDHEILSVGFVLHDLDDCFKIAITKSLDIKYLYVDTSHEQDET